MHKFNEVRLDMDEDSPYVNSGVMLMNLKRLRKEQNYKEVFQFIEKRKYRLILPDQDIISSLYGTKIYTLNSFRYNMTENMYQRHASFEKDLDLEWVWENCIIIHFCGRNKPWKENYLGQLDVFYHENVTRMKKQEIIGGDNLMIGYEQIINEVIRKRQISYEEVLFADNDLVVTVKEFVDKTKQMTEWHRRLTDDLCDIESENGDVRKYMIEFVKEKMKNGYSFIK